MTRFSTYLAIISFTTAFALSGAVAQQTSSSSESPSMGKNSAGTPASDTAFIKKAAQGGLAEVQLGQLAQQKASNQDVQKFAKRMVDDHTKANEQLKQVAEQDHVKLPDTLNAKDKALKAKLEGLSGQQFDQIYMKDMVQDHRKDVAEFERESKAAKDANVKNFAKETLPVLQSHLQEAEHIESMQNTSGSSSKSGQ